jgi:hypothetical protein
LLIAFPKADHAVRESRIAQKQNPKTQEIGVQRLAFLQNQTSHQGKLRLFLKSIRILHGRPSNYGAQLRT